MGGGESKLGDRPEQRHPIKSNLLYFKRCIFLSQKQYNEKHFKPDICYHKQVWVRSNSEIEIDNEVRNTINSLKDGTGNGKVPKPIYVMYAKKMVPSGSMFNQHCLNERKEYNRKLNNVKPNEKTASLKFKNNINNIKKNDDLNMYEKQLKILEESNRFSLEIKNIRNVPKYYFDRTSCINKDKDMNFISKHILEDEEAYNKSLFRKFSFSGYDVHIFIPNLNKEGMYISNLNDYSLSNDWAYTFSTEQYYYSIVSTIKTDYKKIYSKYTSNQDFLNVINDIFTKKEKLRLPFIRESNNTCFWQGCVSDVGEDLSVLPNGMSKDGDLSKAAKNMAPWFPGKCLKRFNYSHHMFNEDDEDIEDKIKDKIKPDGDCFKDFKHNFDKITNLDKDDVKNGKEIDLKDAEDNLLNQFKKCAYEELYEVIGKEKKKEKYSQRYNKNIIKELAKRHIGQPGVQENSFPLFRVNENDAMIKNNLIDMPWGNKLIGKKYVINIEIPHNEGTFISSFNEKYKLMIFSNGIIGVLEDSKKIKYLLNSRFFNQKEKYLILEEGGYLVLYGKQGNDIIQLWSLFVSKIDKAISPYSLILDDDNGEIKIYDNGFNNRASTELTKTMENYGKPGYPSPSDFDFNEYMLSLPKKISTREKDPFYSNNDEYSTAEHEFKLLTEYYSDGSELTDSQIREISDDPQQRDILIKMNSKRNKDAKNYIGSGVNLTDADYNSIDDLFVYELEKDIYVRLNNRNLLSENDANIFSSERTSKEKIKEFIEVNKNIDSNDENYTQEERDLDFS